MYKFLQLDAIIMKFFNRRRLRLRKGSTFDNLQALIS
jgi:hypothetical protein